MTEQFCPECDRILAAYTAATTRERKAALLVEWDAHRDSARHARGRPVVAR